MIRLVSVIGHGKELIPHFIKHYSDYVDEIQFVIYETELYNNLTKEVSELIKGNEKVKIVKVIAEVNLISQLNIKSVCSLKYPGFCFLLKAIFL